MDIRKKQKAKKRRTRKILDDLRKRPSNKVYNDVNSKTNALDNKNLPKYNNALIACNRLTLELFKKTIKSKTVTRVPLTRIDHIDNDTPHNTKALNNCPRKHQITYFDSTKSTIVCSNDVHESSNAEELLTISLSGTTVGRKEMSNSVTSYKALKHELQHHEETEEFNSRHEHLSSSSSSNSEIHPRCCPYQKFMNDLPIYLREHFSTNYGGYSNKNIAYIKKKYLENTYEEEHRDTFNYKNTTENTYDKHKLIQNPIDYIEASISWGQSEQRKQSVSVSNSSSSTKSEYMSLTSHIFPNSPDYQYFPHKLNQ